MTNLKCRLFLCVALPAFLSTFVQADELAEVHARVQSYVDAFNRGDVSALSAHWSEKGVWVSPDGERIEGRDAIDEAMRGYFAESDRARLTVYDPQVRLVTKDVAIEEGRARVVRAGETPQESTYIAVHVREDGEWKLESVRETALPPVSSNYEHLRDLEWMIGSWHDEEGSVSIDTTCSWTKNKNFLTRSFVVSIDGESEMEGTQVIGYDAAAEKIRSWVFDSDGGIGAGVWTRDGDRWYVKSRHVNAAGEEGSSINIITYIDQNSFKWRSTGRELGGEILPDLDEVTIVRKQ